MSEEQESSSMGKAAWQSQAIDGPPISLAFIHHQIASHNTRLRQHTWLAYGTVVLAVALGLISMLLFPHAAGVQTQSVTRVGMILSTLGFAYVMFQMHRQSRRIMARPEDNVLKSLDAYRIQLRRLRDYYAAGLWPWLWPQLPGVAFVLGGSAWLDQRPGALLRMGIMTIVVVVFIVLGAIDTKRKAKAVQQELDALDTMK